jgi:protein-serine/threonine kinase
MEHSITAGYQLHRPPTEPRAVFNRSTPPHTPGSLPTHSPSVSTPLSAMTQFFGSSSPNTSSSNTNNNNDSSNNNSGKKGGPSPRSTSHFPQKLKNLFRTNKDHAGSGDSTSGGGGGGGSSSGGLHSFKFLRNRANSSASVGNGLDMDASPTAHANPYFAHQGQPALRHHNDGSRPVTPSVQKSTGNLLVPPTSTTAATTGAADKNTTAGKEELARKLRRVASAPNAQGLFSSDGKAVEDGVIVTPDAEGLGNGDDKPPPVPSINYPNGRASPPKGDRKEQIKEQVAFRRTYSSNSIKVRNVEVGPGSFDKIRLLGKGDVGKVYLVREKKSSRLYAMKGKIFINFCRSQFV